MASDSIDQWNGHLQDRPFTAAADLSMNLVDAALGGPKPLSSKSGKRRVHNPYRSPPQSRFIPPGFGRREKLTPSDTAVVGHRPRSWWGRNWKWVVPVGVLTPVLFCGGLLTLVFSLAFSAIRNQWYYEQAVARTRANAEVTAVLGTPVDAGFPMGNIQSSGDSGHADISISISGPEGKGTIYVVAKKSDGQWTFSTLEVAIKPTGELIDLLGQ